MTAGAAMNDRAEPCTLGFLIAEAERRLRAAGIVGAEREARWLIESALGLTGSSQLLDRTRAVPKDAMAKIDEFVRRRAAREPLQYILGTQEFCGLEFEVNPTVLIPRPETEWLAQEVIRRLPQGEGATVVDVGTGSGCLAVTLARALPTVAIVATDFSVQALETAKRNARRYGVDTGIRWLRGDLLAPLAGVCAMGTVTAIVANPPYIAESEWSGLQPEVRYEPRMALIAGTKGTEVHERLLEEAIPYLVTGGLLLVELGQGQSAAVRAKVEAMRAYRRMEIVPDEAGIDRFLIVERGT
ncbi:MAG TPA: peptide chain release factor N(5)-glutamine methyltransferase [Nitrospira sp.]|nr:peptide chain release factor N(5)-glutamine methyltransferase [Nitrospira sp.]